MHNYTYSCLVYEIFSKIVSFYFRINFHNVSLFISNLINNRYIYIIFIYSKCLIKNNCKNSDDNCVLCKNNVSMYMELSDIIK